MLAGEIEGYRRRPCWRGLWSFQEEEYMPKTKDEYWKWRYRSTGWHCRKQSKSGEWRRKKLVVQWLTANPVSLFQELFGELQNRALTFYASSASWVFIHTKSYHLYSCLHSSHFEYIMQQVFKISYVDGVIQWLAWPSSSIQQGQFVPGMPARHFFSGVGGK